jgi:DNA-3-methyladenine glycosylase
MPAAPGVRRVLPRGVAQAAPTYPPPLARSFYARPSEALARALLGKRLWCGRRAGIIVETEAYLGPDDLASHARFGPAGRSAVMFGPPGHAYVYFIYGVHEMFNVVAGRDGEGAAVLIRAIEPLGVGVDPASGRGPGKLTRALGIDRRHNGRDLVAGGPLGIARGRRIARSAIACGPRVGVAYAGPWAAAPLRFWLAGHPAVSRGPRPAPPGSRSGA